MGNTTNDNACEWLIQHPQVDDHEVDWAREVIVEQQAEIADKDVQIDKLLDWSYKALKHLPQSYWDSLLEITDEHRGK